MRDPTRLLPPLTLISTPSPLEVGSTAATDDGALPRLAMWLAEVSVQAARDASALAAGAAPPALAPPLVVGVPPAPKVVR